MFKMKTRPAKEGSLWALLKRAPLAKAPKGFSEKLLELLSQGLKVTGQTTGDPGKLVLGAGEGSGEGHPVKGARGGRGGV
jgi:hypothetical protein